MYLNECPTMPEFIGFDWISAYTFASCWVSRYINWNCAIYGYLCIFKLLECIIHYRCFLELHSQLGREANANKLSYIIMLLLDMIYLCWSIYSWIVYYLFLVSILYIFLIKKKIKTMLTMLKYDLQKKTQLTMILPLLWI